MGYGVAEKQGDELLKAFLRNSSEGLFVLSEGKLEYVNAAFEKISGISSRTILRPGFDFLDLVHQEDRKKVREKSFAAGAPPFEFRIVGKRKAIRTVECSLTSVSQNGKKTLGVVRDVTERKCTEQALRENEEELSRTMEKLRKAMGAMIQAMSLTVETRDPYTAGHQKRVSDLARAIASELQLPLEDIDAIRMAASIHDLGKISIPAEILSKPGRISEFEFRLIQNHPQIGFEILRTIDFPWPVAEIVLQHHERINGSGYPKGLRGDEISPIARILAVADVVEAMISHRPYRSALTLGEAIHEITKNRGILYDPDAVDACKRLFIEGRFVFKV